MNESTFKDRYGHEWEEFENNLTQKKIVSPDVLAGLFLRLSDDLAYAKTYFPNSPTERYLNRLAVEVYTHLLSMHKYKKNGISNFFAYDVVKASFHLRYFFLYSFIIFAFSMIIGAFSSAYDENYPRLILGDDYINMTLDNIKAGKPMGVYDDENAVEMFFRIFLNNTFVCFRSFALGLLTVIGTGIIMVYNGIMVGTFQYFFHQQGILLHSASVIWIHGTLEISAIILGGAAGFRIGSSFLFPGFDTRMQSFRKAAKDCMTLVIGLIPVFFAAAFLESFVTRYENMFWGIKLLIIAGSLFFIVWYFIILPQKRYRKIPQNG